ncbi:MAG: Asp-tRNA(Asn)/Glu-tRNA(Gln) amidotransferase subunit GatC [archaeon]|nr:Asp-tRNA(Asn)/Glu-tRNA(Gln) amidotransferase subunit GatC [archaeon]
MARPIIDGELVQTVAQNARLRLSSAEAKKFASELAEVLDFFSKLDSLDVGKEEPSFQPIPCENVFREDKAGQCLSQEDALSNTRHKKNGFFKGPKVIE